MYGTNNNSAYVQQQQQQQSGESRLPLGSCENRQVSPQPSTPMSQPGTPIGYYQSIYQPIPPGTPQMAPQSPAASVRSVGSFAPIGYPQSYGPAIQSPAYTGVNQPYPSPPSQPAPGSYPSQQQPQQQQPQNVGEYRAMYAQLPYGAIPQQQQQQQQPQQNYGYPSPSPVAAAAAYYGAYLANPAMMRGGGGSPTSSVCSFSSDGGVPQSPMMNSMQMSPMNIAPPMLLQRDTSGGMIMPPVGYFLRDAGNVDPDNLCYADIRHNKPGPPSTGESARYGEGEQEMSYGNMDQRQQQQQQQQRGGDGRRMGGAPNYSTPARQQRQQQQQREDGYHRGGGNNRHHSHHKTEQQLQQQQQQPQQQQVAHEGPGKTLRTLLQELDTEDESCIFIVRRIHKFGFKSPVFLREYFEEYGEVRKVLVAHSRQVQPGPNDTTRTRSRPASLGFVLMADPESVQRILADGPVHMVADVEITVHPFENRHPEKESQDGFTDDDTGSRLVVGEIRDTLCMAIEITLQGKAIKLGSWVISCVSPANAVSLARRLLSRGAMLTDSKGTNCTNIFGTKTHLTKRPYKIERLRREVGIHAKLSRELPNHIVTFVSVHRLPTEGFGIFTKFMPHGDLHSFMLKHPSGLPRPSVVHLLRSLLEAVNHIHCFGIVHRDIKPENLLLKSVHPYPLVVLCDFGFSFILGDRESSIERCGTVGYAAPETFQGTRDIDWPKADAFACGSVL
ncbi:hypothetical protein FOL47_004783 [Perkinsus chesapeaki]|uniref:Protein kinase domain-containing protein n=1 Tax=Perkinsus chesapeaki TaxID=330153 RepID=A0A7J6M1T3_PERCH|nr:hypothetical protein FOL47_004783 [Perkinsus chesapeaki]